LRGRAPRRRERRFSRRDAVSASGLQGRTQTEAQDNQRGQTNAWWPNGAIFRRKQSAASGRAEPAPPRGAWRWYPALKDEAPRMRGRWFSRRDALRASACQGRTQAEASHSHRCVYDEPVAKRRRRSGWRYASLPGVRSPPLRGGGRSEGDALAG